MDGTRAAVSPAALQLPSSCPRVPDCLSLMCPGMWWAVLTRPISAVLSLVPSSMPRVHQAAPCLGGALRHRPRSERARGIAS